MHRGSCQCGAINFVIYNILPAIYCCHCPDCKKQSASAFGMSLYIAKKWLTVSGVPDFFKEKTRKGSIKNCFFCATCGSQLWHSSEAKPDHVTVKAGLLEQSHLLTPQAHIWTKYLQMGIALPDNVPQFITQADNFDEWRQNFAGYKNHKN